MGIKRYSAAYRSTNECDEGLYVLHEDRVASHAYDEAKERELFESWYGDLPVSKFKETMCMSWEACAKSRARSAE